MSPIINWMGGWPKEGLVSSADWDERLSAAAKQAEGSVSRRSGGGGLPQGMKRLQHQLSAGLLKDKTGGDAERLLFAAGADAALALLVRKALKPGDLILSERLTSRSALQAFRKAGMQVKAVQGDGYGMDPKHLSAVLDRDRPKMVYISPACTDPEGRSWSADRKKTVAEICRDAGVLLVTDDRQEMLLYDKEVSLDKPEQGSVSIGQLPPGLIAGCRFGWIAGDVNEIVCDTHTDHARGEPSVSPVEQFALSQLLDTQPLEPLIGTLRVQFAERMRRLTDQLGRKGHPDLTWIVPKGGMHLWVILPSGLNGDSLLRGAWLKGLIFQPGSPFFASDPQTNTIRLTYAFADERQAKLGVSRLYESIEEFTGRWSGS